MLTDFTFFRYCFIFNDYEYFIHNNLDQTIISDIYDYNFEMTYHYNSKNIYKLEKGIDDEFYIPYYEDANESSHEIVLFDLSKKLSGKLTKQMCDTILEKELFSILIS